jgi:dipeptidase E
LRWLLKETGADDMIKELVKNGKVYSGWSAGAMVAGPTLQHIEAMETRMAAPEPVLDGLHLTNVVVVPHIDNKDFIESAVKTNQLLFEAGYITAPLRDNQALVINGDECRVI